MLMLSFEASAKSASVALCEDGRLISMAQQCSGLTHSRTLLPMAEDLLKNCDYDLKQIDLFPSHAARDPLPESVSEYPR